MLTAHDRLPTNSLGDRTAAELSGHVALVTGAASGIGRATALLLAERGAAAVALVDRDADGLDAVSDELSFRGARPIPLVVDLGRLDECAALVERTLAAAGRVDIVVNNAAIARPAIAAIDYVAEDMMADLTVNVTAGFVIARDAARHLQKAGRPGSIVFVASINARGAGTGSSGYCASKAAVLGLMRVMAAELGEDGIRVNAVSPGPTDTPRSTLRVGEAAMKDLRERFDGAPLGRLGEPTDIAEAIFFLCSGRANYVTGHDLVVDGGLLASVYDAAQPGSQGN